MCENEASGQQAVELLPCPFCGGSALVIRCPPERDGQETLHRPQCDSCGADCGGCNTPSEAIALWNRRTAAPTPPSTAAGDLARQYLAIARDHAGHIVVEQHGPNGEEPCTVADLIDAALATPPAQVGEPVAWSYERLNYAGKWVPDVNVNKPITDTGQCRNVRPLYAHPPAPSVPWQEQAARHLISRADDINRESGFHTLVAEALYQAAEELRALLSKPAKGDQ